MNETKKNNGMNNAINNGMNKSQHCNLGINTCVDSNYNQNAKPILKSKPKI